jgi:hypothetical protein
MLSNLTEDFKDKLNATVRSPIQLLEFHFQNEIVYLSDQSFEGNPNFTNTYLPYVENWGTLTDNVDIEPVLKQSSIETRQLTITLINNQTPPFSWYFTDNPPENVEVYLYQLFEDMAESDKVLIDIFVCQDPIAISEANITVQIDLVSIIMRKNPFIAGVGSVRDKKFPYIVGQAIDVPGQRIDKNPVTNLELDIAYDTTSEILVANSIGFTASGYIIIDSEIIHYAAWTPGALKTLTRGTNGSVARPHNRGAKVMHYARNYDYALCTGPINSIADVKLDLQAYQNPYELHLQSNPAYIRFLGRLPFFRTDIGETGPPIVFPNTDATHYGLNWEMTKINTAQNATNPQNINNGSADVGIALSETRPAIKATTCYSAAGYATDTAYTGFYTTFEASVTNPQYINQASGVGSVLMTHVSGSPSGLWVLLFSSKYDNTQFKSLGTVLGVTAKVKYRVTANYVDTKYFDTVSIGVMCRDNLDNSSPLTGSMETAEFVLPATGYRYYQSAWWTTTYVFTKDQMNSRASFGVYATAACADGPLAYLKIEIEYVQWIVTYEPPYTADTKTLEVVSHFNKDLSSLGTLKGVSAKIGYWGSASKTNMRIRTVKRTSGDQAADSVIKTTTTAATVPLVYDTVNLYITDWERLANQRVGVRFEMIGAVGLSAGQIRSIAGGIKYVQWIITYQPPNQATPDEVRVIYGERVTATVIGTDGYPITPPVAIRKMLERIGGFSDYIDDDSFVAADSFYDSIDYYFNGTLNENYKLHDAIKELLRQGFCRLVFNQGKIKLLHYTLDAKPVSKKFDDNSRVLKSTTEERIGLINVKNSIFIRYNYDLYNGNYDDVYLATDEESIARFGLLEDSTELSLINDPDIVTYIGNLLMWFKANPYAITKFQFYLSAYELEKLDVIIVETNFNNYIAYAGEVITVSRQFGSGKNNQINQITVTCRKVNNTIHRQELIDAITITDNVINSFDMPVMHEKQLADTIVIDDSTAAIVVVPYGYGMEGYGVGKYGA